LAAQRPCRERLCHYYRGGYRRCSFFDLASYLMYDTHACQCSHACVPFCSRPIRRRRRVASNRAGAWIGGRSCTRSDVCEHLRCGQIADGL
jgi:hypothetical protein